MLNDDHLGLLAADGFSLLMTDSVDILNRSCHADVRIMYRQRFFSENSPKLVQGFNAAPRGSRNFPKSKADFVHKQLCSDIFNLMLRSISKPQVLAFPCFLTEKKPSYLKALSNIVEKLPKQVQVTELPAVSPQQTVHVHSYIYFITRTCLYPSKHQRY